LIKIIRPRNRIIAGSFIIAVVFNATVSFSQTGGDEEKETVLRSAESVFEAMKARDYQAIWGWLSLRTREKIVNGICEHREKRGGRCSREGIANDFRSGGMLSQQYWNGYLSAFNPDIPLNQSRWEMDYMEKGESRIRMIYRKTERPVLLLMYKEDGKWKIGLEETFGPRKLLME